MDPPPYDLTYKASYKGFSAEATRSLSRSDDGILSMRSFIELTLLGQTLTSIEETATLVHAEDRLLPFEYQYVQKGLGSRRRSIRFDWVRKFAEARTDDSIVSLPLDGPILEDMSAMIWLRQQVAAGETSITFRAVDRTVIEEFRYEVEAPEAVETPLGVFRAIKVNRIRDPDSERSTSLWIAPDWGYILVKLEQVESDGSKLTLELAEGSYDGEPVNIGLEQAR